MNIRIKINEVYKRISVYFLGKSAFYSICKRMIYAYTRESGVYPYIYGRFMDSDLYRSASAGKPRRAQNLMRQVALMMDGTAVKSAFALLSAKVTKPA